MNCQELREELSKRGLIKTGNKSVLIDRLKDGVRRGVLASNQSRTGGAAPNIPGFPPGCHWVNISFQAEPVEEPSRLIHGIEFRRPTLPDDETPSGKRLFNADCQFDRLPFIQHAKMPKKRANGSFIKTREGNFQYDNTITTDTVVNIDFIVKHRLGTNSHPAEWFGAFFPVKKMNRNDKFSVEQMTTWTNSKARAYNAGPGGTNYPTFTDFTVNEIKKFNALYLLNGLCPRPNMDLLFKNQVDDPIFGNDLINRVLSPNALLRHKHFKAFFFVPGPQP